MSDPNPVAPTDSELIVTYLKGDDEAFEQLVNRHASLVASVCRSILWQTQDTEDAFQATFLLLAMKAKKLTNRCSVGGWLYHAAYRVSLQTRRTRKRQIEEEMTVEPEYDASEPWLTIAQTQEIEVLHRELAKLPEKYRNPILLCHIQGHTRSEAAKLLDETEAAVKASLARGRKLLRRRLLGRGIALSVVLGVIAAQSAKASAAVNQSLIQSTLAACKFLSSGGVPVDGATPANLNLPSFEIAKSLAQQGAFNMVIHSISKPVVVLCIAAMILITVPIALASNSNSKNTTENYVESPSASAKSTPGAEIKMAAAKKQEKDPWGNRVIPNKSRSDIEFALQKGKFEAEIERHRLLLAAIKSRIRAQEILVKQHEGIEFEQAKAKAELLEIMAERVELEAALREFTLRKKLLDTGGANIPPSSKTAVVPGEALNIEVMDVDSMSRRVVVMADSTIVLPFLGVISVKGESPASLQKKINKMYIDKEILDKNVVQVTRASTSRPLYSK